MDFLKYFSPRVVELVNSPVNGEIKVLKSFHEYYLATGPWTQSGGLIKDLWEPTLKKTHPSKNKSWLILGLSGGTAARIVSQKYTPSQIVGVEIDPIMINLGKKYLKLDLLPQLIIINTDAWDYIARSTLHFDYILVDMYVGDRPPDFLYDQKFLYKLRQLSSLVIINHLFYTDLHRQKAHQIIQQLGKIFPSVKLYRKLTNLMIICS